MSQHNPYAAPQARVGDPETSGPETGKLISGQKLMIYAILISLCVTGMRVALGQQLMFAQTGLMMVSAVMAIVGVLRLAGTFGWGIVVKILLVFLMLLPLISLVTMIILNGKATKALRAAGFKVGFLGVSR